LLFSLVVSWNVTIFAGLFTWLFNLIMQKLYKTPAVHFVILDDADIITMSNDDQKSLNVTDTNTDFSDKAPSRTLWGDD